MGGLGPGIGGLEYLLIAAVTLIVVGPERLPGLLRKIGQLIGKARRMADEFRNSFDEMARQSELDDLRKEVEALRTNTNVVRLGDEADAAFKDIRSELNKPYDDAPRAVMAPEPATGADEWPDTAPVMTPLEAVEVPPVAVAKKASPRKAPAKAVSKGAPAKAAVAKNAPAKAVVARKTPGKTAAAKPASRAPKNSKLDL